MKFKNMATVTPYEALKKMRQLTELSIPFSFIYYSFNSTKQTSEGLKQVDKALLRLGLRKDQSTKSDLLIAYTDYCSDKPRFFNLPLLISINGINIKP